MISQQWFDAPMRTPPPTVPNDACFLDDDGATREHSENVGESRDGMWWSKRNWDSIIAADDVKDVNAGLAKTELGLLGIVVAAFARDAMKVLKERKW